ncbi:hypothetical protein A3K86_14630 [Photobacterium jeanii]|uniref:Lipoprotein n=1 Tax=Photobacterium jeanii TaxID=858640 RepID=A0A178KAT8_9GAMM|nr:hypothetical protein [Photobacterium jeanii]OAN13792.1 hypothetical protein A3K86_14630 [Photobacterium jeanii]PST92747.1 hypothetical protein C9I91_06170 [Photobacterium jeanii]
MRYALLGCALLLAGCSTSTPLNDRILGDADYSLSTRFTPDRFESVTIQPYIQFDKQLRFYQKTTVSDFKRVTKASTLAAASRYDDVFEEPLNSNNRHLYQFKVHFGQEVGGTTRYFFVYDTQENGARWVMNLHHDGLGAEMMFPTRYQTLKEGMSFTASYDLPLSEVISLAQKQKETLLFPVTRLVNALDADVITDDDFADDAFSRSVSALIDYEGLFPIGFSFHETLQGVDVDTATQAQLASQCEYRVEKTFSPRSQPELLKVRDTSFEAVPVDVSYKYQLSCEGHKPDTLAVNSQFWYSPAVGVVKTARDVTFTELVSDDLLDDAMAYLDDKAAFKKELSKIRFTIGSAVTRVKPD